MKPITLTMTAGARPRISPLHLLTWAPSVIDSGGKSHLGSTVILTDGVPRQVLENAEQIDWLFEQATAGVERGDLMTALMAVLEARRQAATPPPG